ncbi:MAG TPA: hypothetical protein VK450_05510, partial [Methanomicrobiales archaeon]|nr:hypothetical protein [Methanomicrobiales archaeon]
MSRANNRIFALLVAAAVLLSLGAGKPQDTRTEIVNLRYFTHPNFTRIVLDIGKLREYTPGELQ